MTTAKIHWKTSKFPEKPQRFIGKPQNLQKNLKDSSENHQNSTRIKLKIINLSFMTYFSEGNAGK